MALSPELKQMVVSAHASCGDHFDPLKAKRAQVLARFRDKDGGPEDCPPTIREQLSLLGLQKAAKTELQQIVMHAMEREGRNL